MSAHIHKKLEEWGAYSKLPGGQRQLSLSASVFARIRTAAGINTDESRSRRVQQLMIKKWGWLQECMRECHREWPADPEKAEKEAQKRFIKKVRAAVGMSDLWRPKRASGTRSFKQSAHIDSELELVDALVRKLQPELKQTCECVYADYFADTREEQATRLGITRDALQRRLRSIWSAISDGLQHERDARHKLTKRNSV